MTPYSYRKIRRSAIVAALFFLTLSLSAQPSHRRKPVLRGTAVLESLPKGWRLIPICIYSGGKFYDADFYQANPAPMSLIQGTIYEVQRDGKPIGNFTVSDAERAGSVWYGLGSFDDFSKKSSKPVQKSSDVDDDRPILRKSAPESSTAAQAPKTPAPDEEKKAEDDPDRPVLKRGTQPPSITTSVPAVPSPQKQVTTELNAAVSDPAQPESRPFAYEWEAAQKQKAEADLRKMAAAELAKKARARGITLGPRDRIEFADFNFRAFDVDYSNNPQIVVAAKFMPTSEQVAGIAKMDQADVLREGLVVTLVARINYDGQLEKIFSEVSDPRDLDDYPVMRLVDAVDVDSDNRAELLFAVIGDNSRKFAVYRLYGLSMNELFTSAPR